MRHSQRTQNNLKSMPSRVEVDLTISKFTPPRKLHGTVGMSHIPSLYASKVILDLDHTTNLLVGGYFPYRVKIEPRTYPR